METKILEEKDILTEKIIGCCFKIHNELGPGFLERIYHNALIIALTEMGLKYETEKDLNYILVIKELGSSDVIC
jgi:GxxExxY protein